MSSANPNAPSVARSDAELLAAASVLAKEMGMEKGENEANYYIVGGKGRTDKEFPAPGMRYQGDFVWIDPPREGPPVPCSNRASETLEDGTIVLNPHKFEVADWPEGKITDLRDGRLFYEGFIWEEEPRQEEPRQEEEEVTEQVDPYPPVDFGPPPPTLVNRDSFEKNGMVYLRNVNSGSGMFRFLPSQEQMYAYHNHDGDFHYRTSDEEDY